MVVESNVTKTYRNFKCKYCSKNKVGHREEEEGTRPKNKRQHDEFIFKKFSQE
jgi:hypothetical protein